MKKIIGLVLNLISHLFPIKKNKLLFQSGRSKVDCHPYAIYKYIKENYSDDYECIWIVERETDTSMLESGDFCYYKTFKSFIAMVTSKYWIRSQSLGSIIKKKKNQSYIQMWHGAGDLKKCGYDCLPVAERKDEVLSHAKEWDYLITTDIGNHTSMLSSTGYKKDTLLLGSADSDILINADDKYIKNIKKKLKLSNKSNKKIIMYAPTFRDFDLESVENKINLPIMKLGNLKEYIILLRLHPLVSKKIENLKLPNNFVNVGWYPNIVDLYLVTDILITDYSSVVFPFMILNKYLILYPYDMERYIDLRGGFYLDYKKDLPGPIVYTEDELIKTILQIQTLKEKYTEKINTFNQKYNILNDGHVCERFVQALKSGKFDKKN